MESNTLFPLLLRAVLYLLIIYFIIVAAVRAGSYSIKDNIRMLNRANAYRMRKEGYSMDEIHNMYYDDDGEFWERLRNTYTPEEQQQRAAEIEKIKNYPG